VRGFFVHPTHRAEAISLGEVVSPLRVKGIVLGEVASPLRDRKRPLGRVVSDEILCQISFPHQAGCLSVTVSRGRKAVAIAVPWVFLAVFATLYVLFALPRVRDGQFLALCLGAFVALVFVVFTVAAVTFSRDVLLDRWPDHTL
jgi:hypothetical protein